MAEIYQENGYSRVFHGVMPQETKPHIGNIDGMSAGEMIYKVPKRKVAGLEHMEIRQAVARYRDIEARRGSLTAEESRELILLEAEDIARTVERWSEEHPKFVAAVHEWVERGYQDAFDKGQQVTRLEVVDSIITELRDDEEGDVEQEPGALFDTLELIRREYEVADRLEGLEVPARDNSKLGAEVLATMSR